MTTITETVCNTKYNTMSTDKLDKSSFWNILGGYTLVITLVISFQIGWFIRLEGKDDVLEARQDVFSGKMFEELKDISISLGEQRVEVSNISADVKELKDDFKRLEPIN